MIRKATAEDIDAVSAIYRRIHEWEQAGRLSIGWLPEVYPVRATAERALRRGELYVLEEDGTVLASAILNDTQVDVYSEGRWRYEASHAFVMHTLTVDPLHGRQGLGRQFVAFYEAEAKRLGFSVLRMDTNEKNSAARALYARLGYREAGIVPCTFNGIPGVGLVLLEKQIEQER